ncbi:hypothetical protein [Marivivens marinus]|uniref:hypothetical protein n=1 Tax=Marivivens marinus TaxID=3110173 RepID=UPI003B849365
MPDIVSDLLTVFGLSLTLVGAYVAARGMIVDNAEAIQRGVTRLAGETDEENLRLKPVQDILSGSSNARLGLYLVAVGTLFQIIPVSYRLVSTFLAAS